MVVLALCVREEGKEAGLEADVSEYIYIYTTYIHYHPS